VNDDAAEALDPRVAAIPDIHGHAKGEHKPYAEERPIPYSARMLFLWFFHACRRGWPRFLMVADHVNYLTFEDPAAVNLVRRALKLAAASDLYGAAETAGVELGHAAIVSDGLRKGMRYSIGAEVDNDPRSRPDAQNIVDAMKPDGMIRSVHFLTIDHPVHGAGWHWPFDNPAFRELYEHVGTERIWQLYMESLLDAIEKLPGHIVGHFYVPAKFGHWPDDEVLQRYEDQLVAACLGRGMAIELNSRYFYRYFEGSEDPALDDENRRRYRAVNLRLLRKAKASGVLIAVGSDAHSPKDQGACFDEVLALLDEAEINEIAFPINGRLARVALRATEEHLKLRQVPVAPPIGSSVSGFSRAELGGASRNGGAKADGAEEIEEVPVAPRRAPKKRAKAPVEVLAEAAPAATEPAPAEPDEAEPDGEATLPEAPLAVAPVRAEPAPAARIRTPSPKRPAKAVPAAKAEVPPVHSKARDARPALVRKRAAASKSAPAQKSVAKKTASPATAAKRGAAKTKSASKAPARKAPARAAGKPSRAKKSAAKPVRARAAKPEKRPSQKRAPAKKAARKKPSARKAPARKKAAKTRR
jgi:HisJ family histidinol phosphate phosphatase